MELLNSCNLPNGGHSKNSSIGSSKKITKSQISYSRKRAFAWVWVPGTWLKGDVAPLVLSIRLPKKDRSRRWKQVVRPANGHWMHHLEIRDSKEIDRQAREWIKRAYEVG
jgi:hypothetical protein